MDDKPEVGPEAAGARIHKSCDACKTRKVRCPIANHNLPTNYSLSNQQIPHAPDSKAFSDLPTIENEGKAAVPELPGSSAPKSPPHRIQELHVDRVLARAKRPRMSSSGDRDEAMFVPLISAGGRNSLTFFSDARLLSLSARLRNNKVNELVGRISTIVAGRLGRADRPTSPRRIQQPYSLDDAAKASSYIRLYFKHVHPMFPFLNKTVFESTVSGPNFFRLLEQSKPWSCLYHTVLALGSQYEGKGTFEPGKGESWNLFSVALRCFSDLLLLPDSLITLQALTAMSVYGLGLCGLAVEPIIMSEATRRAQMMSNNNNFTGSTAYAYQKSFWILYTIEKITSFYMGRSSGFVDSDILCPIPTVPEASLNEFNWFLHFIRFGRLLSRAYTSLFSVGVSGNSNSYYLDIIHQLTTELEEWQSSLPDNGFRPKGFIRPQAITGHTERAIGLIIHYLYNSFLLTLSRTTLSYLPSSGDSVILTQRGSNLKTISAASRSILELTTMIEVEPYTVTWIIAGIPLTALFVLFDIVIHDPRQPETGSNLALLDMVAGHFSRIEYASNGTLPGSLISEFTKIARDYVNEVHYSGKGSASVAHPGSTPQILASTLPAHTIDGNSNRERTRGSSVGLCNATSEPRSTVDLMPSSFADFSFDAGSDPISPGTLMGTDVMGIFSYFLPDLDPMFYQRVSEDYFSQGE
nr:uncharacterized protein CTRU02_00540 [Colletotrichum truncatum]KAF6801791.1 hypothetical protein CTRU02_00540 [Colletotrichum truncatum]